MIMKIKKPLIQAAFMKVHSTRPRVHKDKIVHLGKPCERKYASLPMPLVSKHCLSTQKIKVTQKGN